jgi:hypothetical protein
MTINCPMSLPCITDPVVPVVPTNGLTPDGVNYLSPDGVNYLVWM